MNVREFLTKWGFNIEHEKLTKTEQQLEAIKNRLNLIAGIEITKKLFDLTERFAQFGEELHVAAQSAGLTAEEFQKLTFSAQQSSVSQEEMESSLKLLSRRLYEARLGSADAQKAFALAGFSGEQVARFKTSKDALLALGDKMRDMKDPIQKAALAQELMGRSSLHMVGYLSQGSKAIQEQGNEAQKLGLVLSSNQVEALVDVEHSLQKLWALFKAIGATIASQVAPSLKTAIDLFFKWFAAHRAIIQLNFTNVIHQVLFALGYLAGAVETIIDWFLKWAKVFHLDGQILPLIVKIASLVGGLLLARKVIQGTIDAVMFFGRAIKFVQGIMSPWIFIIAALVIAAHDLWAAFHGEKGWVQEALEAAGVWKYVESIFMKIFEWAYRIKDAITGAFSGIGETLGKIGFKGALGAIVNPIGFAGQLAGGAVSGAKSAINGDTTITAPITVNVPHGTNPNEVGKFVQAGVREHLDRVHREAARSSQPAVAY